MSTVMAVASENGYLAHYGVKGMKWGVWNVETRERYEGGSRDTRDPSFTRVETVREKRIRERQEAAARKKAESRKGFFKGLLGMFDDDLDAYSSAMANSMDHVYQDSGYSENNWGKLVANYTENLNEIFKGR